MQQEECNCFLAGRESQFCPYWKKLSLDLVEAVKKGDARKVRGIRIRQQDHMKEVLARQLPVEV